MSFSGSVADQTQHKGTGATPPVGVVILALLLGTVLVGGVTLGGYLSLPSATAPSEEPSETVEVAIPTVVPTLASPTPDPADPRRATEWQMNLRSSTCPSPCTGGAACLDKPKHCTSELTCIPGAGGAVLGPDEAWSLHLSAVIEVAPDGTALDPCATQRDFWVCRAGTYSCISQREACMKPNGAISSVALPISGTDLHAGTSFLEVREGGPSGPIVAASRPFPKYARLALCGGLGIGTYTPRIKKVTFFLLPP